MTDLTAKHFNPQYGYGGGFEKVAHCEECGSISDEFSPLYDGCVCPHCGSSKVYALKHPARYRGGRWEIFTPKQRKSRLTRMKERAYAKLRAAYDDHVLPAIKRYCPFVEFEEKLK